MKYFYYFQVNGGLVNVRIWTHHLHFEVSNSQPLNHNFFIEPNYPSQNYIDTNFKKTLWTLIKLDLAHLKLTNLGSSKLM
jgi:hypothetical protein